MPSLAESWRQCVRSPADNSAWDQLLTEHPTFFRRIVVRTANRFGRYPSPEDVDDACQEACLHIARKAHEGKFQPDIDDGSLIAYLAASLANAAHDHFRAQHAQSRNVNQTVSIDAGAVSETRLGIDPGIDREILIRELDKLVEGNRRDRDVYLLWRQGSSAREIAALPTVNLTESGVESLVRRIHETLRKRIGGDARPAVSG
jgi:RNA polymerase sigma factor (sigma-70 family)